MYRLCDFDVKSTTYIENEQGRWHNGSLFVFCLGDCQFESKPSPTSADACGEVISCDAGHQEIGMCSTRGGSWGMYTTFNKAAPTLDFKPRGDVTRNPKQGTSLRLCYFDINTITHIWLTRSILNRSNNAVPIYVVLWVIIWNNYKNQ